MKERGDKIVMVTAYDAPGARFAEDAGIDIVLVGDTAAMVVLGHEGTTVPVTVDEMLFLTRTVARHSRRPLVVGDLPVRLVPGVRRGRRPHRDPLRQGGRRRHRQARGRRPDGLARPPDRRGGHPGDGPHRPDARSRRRCSAGSRRRARRPRRRGSCVVDAHALEDAGCCSLVLEAIPAPVAARITAELRIPTIGIGAGPECDGQVLVYHDLLGLTEGHLPRFVKRYANLSREIRDALEAYAAEVRSGAFPGEEHTYAMSEEELEAFTERRRVQPGCQSNGASTSSSSGAPSTRCWSAQRFAEWAITRMRSPSCRAATSSRKSRVRSTTCR